MYIVDINRPDHCIDLKLLTDPEQILDYFSKNNISKYVYGICYTTGTGSSVIKFGISLHGNNDVYPGGRIIYDHVCDLKGWTEHFRPRIGIRGKDFYATLYNLGINNKDFFELQIWDLNNYVISDNDYSFIAQVVKCQLIKQFEQYHGYRPVGDLYHWSWPITKEKFEKDFNL